MKTNNTYLHFVAYKELGRWDIKSFRNHHLHFAFPCCTLGQVLSVAKTTWVNIEDNKQYPILGVHAHGEGVYINNISKGKDLTMKKYQKSLPNHLFYCKVRTVNGQWGVVYPQYADSYGSSNMQYLAIDTNKVVPEYLECLLKIRSLTNEWDKNAVGADGRHFPLRTLLNLQIPLPSLEEQQALVDAYNHNLQQATELEQQAENGEKEIEDVIMQRLGITIPKIDTSKKGLSFVSYKDVQDRWDLYNVQTSIFTALAKSTYKAQQIGSIYNFITRGWKKTEDKFRYIELGSVDAADGIMSASELLVKDAPSRATQKVSEGDLILGTTRPYLKKFAIVPQEFADCVCSSGFQVIANNSTNNLQFLYEYLKTPAAIAQYEYFMTGALYPAITNADLKKVEIPLPPLDVQAEIVAEVQAQRVKIAEYKTTAATLRKDAITQFEQAIFE